MLDLRSIGSLGLVGDRAALEAKLSQIGALETPDDSTFFLDGLEFSSSTAEESYSFFDQGIGDELYSSDGSIDEVYHCLHVNGRRFDVFSFDPTRPLSTYSEMSILLARACAGIPIPTVATTWVLGSPATPEELSMLNLVVPAICASSSPVRHLIEDIRFELSRRETLFRTKCLYSARKSGLLKYQFIELYRIVEAQFLYEAKDYFEHNFLSAPQEVTTKVAKWISSEREKIAEISDRTGLRAEFEFFYAMVDDLRIRNNRLAHALMRKLRESTQATDADWKKGASLIYFIRCAIVHAGQMDIRYEYFSDGDELLAEVMDTMESIGFALTRV